MQYNTKVKFDKQYSWETLLNKYFDSNQSSIDSDQEVRINIATLHKMMSDSHELGRLRERTKNRVIKPNKMSV